MRCLVRVFLFCAGRPGRSRKSAASRAPPSLLSLSLLSSPCRRWRWTRPWPGCPCRGWRSFSVGGSGGERARREGLAPRRCEFSAAPHPAAATLVSCAHAHTASMERVHVVQAGRRLKQQCGRGERGGASGTARCQAAGRTRTCGRAAGLLRARPATLTPVASPSNTHCGLSPPPGGRHAATEARVAQQGRPNAEHHVFSLTRRARDRCWFSATARATARPNSRPAPRSGVVGLRLAQPGGRAGGSGGGSGGGGGCPLLQQQEGLRPEAPRPRRPRPAYPPALPPERSHWGPACHVRGGKGAGRGGEGRICTPKPNNSPQSR